MRAWRSLFTMARPENDQTGIRKLGMVGKKTFAVSLPVELISRLDWRKGDDIIVRRIGKKIIIERREP